MLENNMHMPSAHVLKSVLPAAKMCTQGAECTLNFEHFGNAYRYHLLAAPELNAIFRVIHFK